MSYQDSLPHALEGAVSGGEEGEGAVGVKFRLLEPLT